MSFSFMRKSYIIKYNIIINYSFHHIKSAVIRGK